MRSISGSNLELLHLVAPILTLSAGNAMSLRNRKDGGSLREIFGNEISSSAFQVIDGETCVVGKFAQIALMENGLFDIWLVGPELESLSTRKLNIIVKKFPQEATFTVLTGEAYTQVQDKDLVPKSLSLLGIKKKRKLSPETREKLIRQLKTARALAQSASVSDAVDSDEYQEVEITSAVTHEDD